MKENKKDKYIEKLDNLRRNKIHNSKIITKMQGQIYSYQSLFSYEYFFFHNFFSKFLKDILNNLY